MNIYGYHYKNIRPLSGSYQDDPDISLKHDKIVTIDGLDSYLLHALSGSEDVTYNNYNQLWLTDKKDRNSILEHKVPTTQYPQYKTTYLKLSGTEAADAKFLVVNGSTGACEMSGVSASIDNRYYVELELASERFCFVRHYSSEILKYLTTTQDNSSTGLTFTARTSSVDEQRGTDPQIFEYMLDEASGWITLFANISSPTDASIPFVITNHQETGASAGTAKSLSAIPLPSSTTFMNSGNKFYIKPKTVNTPTVYDTGASWVSYLSSVDKNTNDVDISETLTNVKGNYILHTSTNNLDYENFDLKCKLLPLKTSLTPEGGNNKHNPYSGEVSVNHRSYGKLFTGGNEEFGYDSIYTGYESGTKEIKFDTDKLTYFRAPQVISPYSRVNVNNLSLHTCGAIAGDAPIKSDKMFKQLRVSRNNTANRLLPENSELRGTWLCSWLSGNSNSSMSPIWVDRYYNPDFYTQAAALTAGTLTPVMYIDNFSYVTKVLGASASHITLYDKYSDLTIEPGVLYAYYHTGPGNSQKIIDSLASSRLTRGLNEHLDINSIAKPVVYDYTGPTHVMSNGDIHTGHAHSSSSIVSPQLYEFTGNSYGLTESISTEGSFSLAFWMNCTDWSKPFGNQILGNFITHGFGIYNKDYIAPFLTIPALSSVAIYNSDFEFVGSYNLERTIKSFVRKGNLENFWVIDSDNNICEYTLNGSIRNIITSTHLTDKTISDIDVNGTKLYALIAPDMTSFNGQYLEYDMSNKTASYQGTLLTENIWNYGTGVPWGSASSIHATTSGLSASVGVVITIHDALSARTSDTHDVSGSVVLGSTSFVDVSGNPWTVQRNKVHTYDTTATTNITAISSDNIIESIACDTSNNIWALHSNIKLSKLNSDRKHLFTLTLSSLSSLSDAASARIVYNRYLDFVTEFDSTGNHTESCITINQSVSGCKFIKISMDGSTVTTLNTLSGVSVNAAPVTFFNTPMKSWKTVTGHDYLRKHQRDDQQQIKAKMNLSREYNTSTTTETFSSFSLTHNVSAIKPGWNHFGVIFDSERGTYNMYVNTHLVDSVAVPKGAFSRASVFDGGPVTVGATPFYTKSYLFDHLNQPNNNLCKNISIKGLNIYNKSLDFYELKAHYDVYNFVMPVRWNMPIGQRSYLDTIERVFNLRVPGRKSEMFNLNIYNTSLTDPSLKADLQGVIQDNIYDAVPANTKLRDIKWDGVSLSASSSTIQSSPTTINQPSNQVHVEGGDYTYD